jgi:branched-chain amino acid aminotransferase
MKEAVQTARQAPPRPAPAEQDWQVRAACPDDVAAVVAAVGELLVELGGTPAAEPAMRETVRALIDNPEAGAVLVAEAGAALVGVLAASWQMAIHVPGTYALIQDLWVHPVWRSQATGAGLIAAIVELARGRGVARLEVGLPRERFAGFQATEAFYLGNGFTPLGPRMRRVLS